MLKKYSKFLHPLLFIATVITTTLAGAEWMFGKYVFVEESRMTWANFLAGFQFSFPFLMILTVHEFGHYFTAQYHKIKVTLPYYIPLWFGFLPLPSFGTMGAFIKIKEQIPSKKIYFDIGISGPIAGFVVAIFVMWYGFTHLPEPDYIFQIHPEYAVYGAEYAQHVYNDEEGISFRFGGNILFWLFENYILDDPAKMPHPNEIIHYPFLLAGYLALFFTAINLLPIGQLDGGHVIFGLLSTKSARFVNRLFYLSFLFYAGLGVITLSSLTDTSYWSVLYFIIILLAYLYFVTLCLASIFRNKKNRWLWATLLVSTQFFISSVFGYEGYSGWLLFAFLIGRVIGVYHPRVSDNSELDLNRKILGWIAIIIFIVCFSPQPFIIG
jgi:membrane-associated protease RseP (regulator of RpoE activity)